MDEKPNQFDLCVVGGGINGAGIARDAAGRGLKVLLCEQGDLAQATSSSSTKLIHGGLRYLEYYAFRLVRESLKERERLLAIAPHIIWPMHFILPHQKHLRPSWMIQTGLWLYDHLNLQSSLPSSRRINIAMHKVGKPLQEHIQQGFVYADCWVQDARLVVLNAMDAKEKGAEIRTRTKCEHVKRTSNGWEITLTNTETDEQETILSKGLVNATGPWASSFLQQCLKNYHPSKLRLVQGSHIIVPRLTEHDYAYTFQLEDGRILFAIPYEQKYTLIGTTETDFSGDPKLAEITPDEIDYLCASISKFFKKKITKDDVVWSYSGIRPLYESEIKNSSAISRDYVLDLQAHDTSHPLLTIYGGKLTTYRTLAEKALQKLAPYFPSLAKPWTGTAPLPGGNFGTDFGSFLTSIQQQYSWLPPPMAWRFARNYGTLLHEIIGDATDLTGLGKVINDNVYEAEIAYLKEHEWARTAEDILWRRTKLGLHLTEKERKKLEKML